MLEDYRQDPDSYYEGGSLFDVPDDADKFTDALTDATISQSGDTLTIGSRTVVITGDTKISLILKPSEAKSRASVLRDQVMTDWSADYEVVEGASASSIAADLKNFDITGELYTVYGDKNKSDVAGHIYLVVTSVKNSDTTRPTISSQPAAAAYEKGDTPADLTVAAAPGAGGALSYQWQSSTDGSNWSNIANAATTSYAPSTAAGGTTYYRVVVTEDQSGSDVTVTSNAAAVVVTPVPTRLEANKTGSDLKSDAVPDGVVKPTDDTFAKGDDGSGASDVYGTISENVVIKFKTTSEQNAKKITLTVTDIEGKTYYKEELSENSFTAVGGHFFYFNWKEPSVSSGRLLEAMTQGAGYFYTITTPDETILSGSFVAGAA